MKTGLSSHFSGKSKSFVNQSDTCTVKDLEKSENPFNKRKILLSSRRSSFYSSFNPKSMPLLAFEEDEDEEDHHQYQQGYPLSSSSPSSSSSSSSLEKKEQEERGVQLLRSPVCHRRLAGVVTSDRDWPTWRRGC